MEEIKESEKITLSAVADADPIASGSTTEGPVASGEHGHPSSVELKSGPTSESSSPQALSPGDRFAKFTAKSDPRIVIRRAIRLTSLVGTTGVLFICAFFIWHGAYWWQADQALREGVRIAESGGSPSKAADRIVWGCTFIKERFHNPAMESSILRSAFEYLKPHWDDRMPGVSAVYRDRLKVATVLSEKLQAQGMLDRVEAATTIEQLATQCYQSDFIDAAAAGFARASVLRSEEIDSGHFDYNAERAHLDKFDEMKALARININQADKAFAEGMTLYRKFLDLQAKEKSINKRDDLNDIYSLIVEIEKEKNLRKYSIPLIELALSRPEKSSEYYSLVRALAEEHAKAGRTKVALAMLSKASKELEPWKLRDTENISPFNGSDQEMSDEFNAVQLLMEQIRSGEIGTL